MAENPVTAYLNWLISSDDEPFPEVCRSLSLKSILSLAEQDALVATAFNQLFNTPYAYSYPIEKIAKMHKRLNTTYKFKYIPLPKKEEPKPVKKEKDIIKTKTSEETKQKIKEDSIKNPKPPVSNKAEVSKPDDITDKEMLVSIISEYHKVPNSNKLEREVAYVTRIKDQKFIYQTDDMIDAWYGPDDFNDISDISRLTHKRISARYRNNFIQDCNSKSGMACYAADIHLNIHKTLEWKKKHPEQGFYKLRVAYIDIEIFQEGYGRINFADIKGSATKFPINLITIYDNYLDKYFTLVFNLFDEDIQLEQITKYLDYKDECDFEVEIFKTEYQMLQRFFQILRDIDPDLISGWNTDEFDLPYIYYRSQNLKVKCELAHGKEMWVEYREKTNKFNDVVNYAIDHMGYTVPLDYQRCYRERSIGKRENYKLGTIAQYELGITKLNTEDGMDKIFKEEPERFIAYNINDVHLVRKLDDKLKYIDLCFNIIQFSNISWDNIYTTLNICDGILYEHLLKENKTVKVVKEHEDASIQGAYVRTPIKGIHDWLGDLDLTSLYPYIMARYNISGDTLDGKLLEPKCAHEYLYDRDAFNKRDKISYLKKIRGIFTPIEYTPSQFIKMMDDRKLIITHIGTIFVRHEEKTSVLYNIIDMLISKRKEYKKLMFENINDPLLYDRYNGMQLTVKIITNSLYGGQANKRFRLYCEDVARSITGTGREIIKISAVVANECINQITDKKSVELSEVPIPSNWPVLSEEVLHNVIYGDSVIGDTLIKTDKGNEKIEDLWNRNYSEDELYSVGTKEYILNPDFKVNIDNEDFDVKMIMKHSTKKTLYEIELDDGHKVTVTEDHSLVVKRNNVQIVIKPEELCEDDEFITIFD